MTVGPPAPAPEHTSTTGLPRRAGTGGVGTGEAHS